jgi:hypothetical protein
VTSPPRWSLSTGSFRWLIAGGLILCLGSAALIGSRGFAQEAATPTATPCGEEISSWGDASTNDVTITLTLPAPETGTPVASPEATPQNPGEDVFNIRFSNHGAETATVRLPDVQLTLCDGSAIAPNASAFAEPEVTIPANEAVEITVVFSHDPAVPALSLIVPVSTESLTAGHVEFILRLVPSSSSAGGDVVGANAVGGDGAAGEDAVDASPVGN